MKINGQFQFCLLETIIMTGLSQGMVSSITCVYNTPTVVCLTGTLTCHQLYLSWLNSTKCDSEKWPRLNVKQQLKMLIVRLAFFKSNGPVSDKHVHLFLIIIFSSLLLFKMLPSSSS